MPVPIILAIQTHLQPQGNSLPSYQQQQTTSYHYSSDSKFCHTIPPKTTIQPAATTLFNTILTPSHKASLQTKLYCVPASSKDRNNRNPLQVKKTVRMRTCTSLFSKAF
uniref:Uncharacterized protein n=1 Tax=Rhizophora mucronata TaxID=61149 RepID=A0A2P2QYX1_RHIMU